MPTPPISTDPRLRVRTTAGQGAAGSNPATPTTTLQNSRDRAAETLRVISGSQADAQPVFNTIQASALRLLGAYSVTLTRLAGDQIELVALTSTDDAADAALRANFPQPLQSDMTHARAIRDRAPVNIADAAFDSRRTRPGRMLSAKAASCKAPLVRVRPFVPASH